MVGLVVYNPLLVLGAVVASVFSVGVWISALVAKPGTRLARDRAIVGACLLGTALVFFFLSQGGDQLFSDAASSVSNAPGP
jgi:hypothetical protein